jgi:Dolichyl-phosphate-mannose-protein mannosyltransferase
LAPSLPARGAIVGDSPQDDQPGGQADLIGPVPPGIIAGGGSTNAMEQPLRRQPIPRIDPHVAARTLGGVVAPMIAVAIAASFALMLLGAIDFPLGTHADETSKVLAVLHHFNNFNHPLLMLHLARATNAVAGLTDPQQVVELGRALAVLTGALGVFATYLLAREALPAPVALAAAAAVAVTPLVAMHARFFKEDVFLLPLILLAVLALIETLKAPTLMRALLLGLAGGLAATAKYIGIALVPFAVVVLLLGLSSLAWRERLRLAGTVIVVALAVIALLQIPALWDLRHYGSAVYGNLRQAEVGVGVRVPLALGHGLFHLRHSLLPGLGAPLLALGLLGFAAPFMAPPERRTPLAVIAVFAALWLVAHEISPFKPYPDFQRYMVPLAPFLLILATAFVYELGQRPFPAWSAPIAALAIITAAAAALYASLRIAGAPDQDLRLKTGELVLRDTPNAAFDNYTRFQKVGQPAGHGRAPAERTTLLVTSSFVYDRYLAYGAERAPKRRDQRRGSALRRTIHPSLSRTIERSAGLRLLQSGAEDRGARRRRGAFAIARCKAPS